MSDEQQIWIDELTATLINEIITIIPLPCIPCYEGGNCDWLSDELESYAGSSIVYQKGHTYQTGLSTNVTTKLFNMIRKQKKESYIGSVVTKVNKGHVRYLNSWASVNQWTVNSGAMTRQQQSQRRQKYTVFLKSHYYSHYYESEPTKWRYLKQKLKYWEGGNIQTWISLNND